MNGFQKNVLNYLRRAYENDQDDAVQSTEQIATALNTTPKRLYNHDTDKGPLYHLWHDGYVSRLGDRKSGYSWCANGAEIVWN